MAKVKIDIDTESGESIDHGRAPTPRLTAQKVGLLSSIALSQDLIDAFANGVGSHVPDKAIVDSYNVDKLRAGKNALKNINRCTVIAVVGGSVTFNAIKPQDNNPPFVSLLGNLPNPVDMDIGNCVGGVSTEGWKANKERIDFLVKKGIPLTSIGLYCNPNSGTHLDEIRDWDNLNPPVQGVSSVIKFSGAGPAGANDVQKFNTDLNVTPNYVPARITTLVISADAFFQGNKNDLIKAANTWVSNLGTRYICYPFQEYANPNGVTPTGGQAALYGPELKSAYRLLGFVAKQVLDPNWNGEFVEFYTVANRLFEIPLPP